MKVQLPVAAKHNLTFLVVKAELSLLAKQGLGSI